MLQLLSPAGATVDEAEEFLARHPEIVAIDAYLVDANGVGRGKMLRRHELLPLYSEGRHFPGSVLGVDVTGEDVEATGLVWSAGDADHRAWPIPGTLVTQPWTAPPRGQVQLTMHGLDGAPMDADPRHALARQQAAAQAVGFQPTFAFELEFYLLDRNRGQAGLPVPAASPLTGHRPDLIRSYCVEELDGMETLIAAIYEGAEAQRLPIETLISEYAPGQYELTLHYRRDALRAADDLVMLKRLLRNVAARHGMIACFMAKPFAAYSGSGMHLHAGLRDAEGRNVFADAPDDGGPGGLAALLREAVAGLLRSMPDSMLVFAPHLNSWRRFAARTYAPIEPTWSANNRTVAVRIPAGPAANRHLEHRTAGVDANPYLVGAAVLGGMLQGMAAGLDPGPPLEGDGYAAPGADTMRSLDWRSAIEQAAASDFLAGALGARMRDIFVAIKRAEHARFAAEITEAEYRCYMEIV